MRKLIRLLFGALLAAGISSLAVPAQAQIYKYRREDGTVVYTDKLSDLPPKLRAKYAEREAEKERQRRRLEASVGKAEAARREADAKRKAELKRQMAAADQRRRRRELQALLKRLNEEEDDRQARKRQWQKRVAKARAEVKALYAEYEKTRTAYDEIAVRADFTLFPGQAQEKEKLRKKLDELEKKLDAALEELNEKIPTEARKAGIPPGWIR